MVLKEAYRYQNYLDSLMHEVESHLTNKDFVTTIKQTHNRNKVNSEATNEVVEVEKPIDIECNPNQLLDIAVKVIDEKEKLTDAITDAKKQTAIDIDSSIAMNKVKQNLIIYLNMMLNYKDSQKETTGKDYKFDVNGEQKSYIYPVTEVTTIDYNRNDVKGLVKKYQKETDAISTKLDEIQIMTKVDYSPIWDLDTPLEDVVL